MIINLIFISIGFIGLLFTKKAIIWINRLLWKFYPTFLRFRYKNLSEEEMLAMYIKSSGFKFVLWYTRIFWILWILGSLIRLYWNILPN